MISKSDEIKHLKQLHLEYKKKYNSKRQTLEEDNKTISINNSKNNINNENNESNTKYINTNNQNENDNDNENELNTLTIKNISPINNNTITSNNNKTNTIQNTNTNNSISEHIICEEERNQNISSRKAFPLHQINFPIEKKIINDDENNNINNINDINIGKQNNDVLNINNNNNINPINNNEDITFKDNPYQKVRTFKDDELFDSKIKIQKMNEFSMILDEKINDLKRKLNLNYNSHKIEKINTFDNRYSNNFLSGLNNLNLNSINTESKGHHINNINGDTINSNTINNINNINSINNNIENSNIFNKNNINMNIDSLDLNSINMDPPSFGHQILVNNNNINNNTISVADYNFISERNAKLSMNKLTEISEKKSNNNPYTIILSYLNSKDTFQIFQANKKLRRLFIDALNIELNTYIINKFKHITKNILDNYSFYIGLNKNIKNKQLKIFLILKAKIIAESLIKKSIHLQYFAHFPCDNNQFVQNTFVFDIKSSPIYYWAIKESTNFNNDELNKAYFMNVMQYAVNDYAEFTLNILTDKGLMDIRKLVWDKITVFKTPNEDFLNYSNENILKREIVDFDVSRYCEMELCKGKWNDIILLENSDNYIGELKNKFKENFNILKILFDNVGYLIFKFYLEGSKPGVINADEEIGMKIIVLPQHEDKSNETKKNNLVFDRKNEIQLHLGDVFIFYISKNV